MYGSIATDMAASSCDVKFPAACDPVTGRVHRPGKPIVKIS